MITLLRKHIIGLGLLFFVSPVFGQQVKPKKYPSLLWEISGKGLKRSSYLIGTMHVSNKLAFNLPDSFYLALRSVDIVALENNPESWQEDMSRYELGMESEGSADIVSLPAQYLTENAIRFFRYYGKLQRGLSSNPSALNNLLYRNYGEGSGDFEEDTYLDMYIFQCGKKWGKRIAGVESYGESMRLMMEAYRDASRDKKKKDRSYSDFNGNFSNDKLQEAYRTGNLDLLDSINRYNSSSDAFDEKFIYRRNEIQTHSIDSIIRTGSSLFVGVGAAHLPGPRGVIELLRSRGYTLRPVIMGERASRQKEQVDKIRVPVVFHKETADDSVFSVDVPGKLYKLSEDAALKQQQYADLANGSYYMVTRLMTNAWMWDQQENIVLQKVDSLLYEHIPGKIISRITIRRNGYSGFDIVNRTRRGDLQRYNIFVTPFEVIMFKMSGTGDYVRLGNEAERFFSSIRLKEYRSNGSSWEKFAPSFGGFTVFMPHQPYVGNDGSWIFDARETPGNNFFRVIRTDINNFQFIEEDSFDLGLLNESFRSSSFIRSQEERKPSSYQGYPSLDGKYTDKFGNRYFTRFVLQGTHYYTLIAKASSENESVHRFLNSFEIVPFDYGNSRTYTDTTMYFSVTAPVSADTSKIKLNMPRNYYMTWTADDSKEELTEKEKLQNGFERSRIIHQDSSGEQISVLFFQKDIYFDRLDSTASAGSRSFKPFDSTMVLVRERALGERFGYQVQERIFSDTNSSRRLWTQTWYRSSSGTGYKLVAMTDSLSKPSAFLTRFFESFRPSAPVEDLAGKSGASLFFQDMNSADSSLRKRALQNIHQVKLDSSDLPAIEKAMSTLGWKEKKYLDNKVAFIDQLGEINTKASAHLLERIFHEAGDTLRLQYAALENLLQHRSKYAYEKFRNILINDPPVIEQMDTWFPTTSDWTGSVDAFDNGSFLDELFDSLELTRTILPELLPLLNLKDYEAPIMKLLEEMLKARLVSGKDYQDYFSKFYLEAKQELKKQSIAEKKKAIEWAENENKGEGTELTREEKDLGNDLLSRYAALLLPFEDEKQGVRSLIGQLLGSNDKRLVLNTVLLLLKNGKPVSDSLLLTLAATDEFRFELYRELYDLSIAEHFPPKERDQVNLARSALLFQRSYDRPDTINYIGKRALISGKQEGFLFFFKYKMRLADLNWKFATAGIISSDTTQFNTDIIGETEWPAKTNRLTDLGSVRFKEDQPLDAQLEMIIQKWLIGQRKSGKEFYVTEEDDSNEED